MKTPVLIAAYNEAAYLGRTLRALDSSTCEPLVIANGCQDDTVAVAESFGAAYIELDEAAKLPALQVGVKALGRRALEPFLLTDADGRPLFRRGWRNAMVGALPTDGPGTVAGPVGYIDGTLADRTYNTLMLGKTIFSRWRQGGTFMTGNNMAVYLRTSRVLEAFLALPNMWPGEDAAISKVVYRNGGSARQLITPRAYMLVSTRHAVTFQERVTLGGEVCQTLNYQRYLARAPQGSLPASAYGY